MRSALLVLALAFAVFAVSDNEMRTKFTEFQQTFGKSYSASEFESRFRIFKDNMNKAAQLSAQNKRASFGMNKFSDLSADEFAAQYLMPTTNFADYVAPAAKDFSVEHKANAKGCTPDATNYNWFSQCGACTPIYNQGQCGSCWAFSATETIESYLFLGGGSLTPLSISQIVDCDTAGEDEGCNGGFPTGAYQYVESAGGLDTGASYPYTAEGGESGSCNFQPSMVAAKVNSYASVTGETGLYQQTSSASGGPVSVCVDASSWQTYTGGVLSQCGTSVDHCVQLVGYANYGQTGAYWIVRNSWGEDWGEAGFIYIAIGEDLCDIGDYATVVVASA